MLSQASEKQKELVRALAGFDLVRVGHPHAPAGEDVVFFRERENPDSLIRVSRHQGMPETVCRAMNAIQVGQRTLTMLLDLDPDDPTNWEIPAYNAFVRDYAAHLRGDTSALPLVPKKRPTPASARD